MKLWQGQAYKDDRLFILDLHQASKGKETVWAVATRRNIDGFPPFRVDDFTSKEEAVDFIERTEPQTPRISLDGASPKQALPYPEYLMLLKREGLPSAMDIYEINKSTSRKLIIHDVGREQLEAE